MDFLSGILVGIGFGFLWGVWRATRSFMERIVEQPEEIREIMDRAQRMQQLERVVSKPSKSTATYRTEYHQGVCYVYDLNDNFMAQGADITEALNKAKIRFPELKLDFELSDTNKSNQ